MSADTGATGKRASDRFIESLLYALSVYLAPIGIAAITVVALFLWHSQYPLLEGTPLDVHALVADSSTSEPTPALLTQLDAAPAKPFHRTHLSTAPVWFTVAVPVRFGARSVVEFPSRHAVDIACWDANTMQLLGRADRGGASGAFMLARAGFALTGAHLDGQRLLCRGDFAGPARLTVRYWNSESFDSATQAFDRDSGLLDGGLGILALFVLLTALINREWIYIVFSAWLVANLRLAALSTGWDAQWLGQEIPVHWLLFARKLNISAYYMLTVTLFGWLFSDDLKRVGHRWLLRWNQWTCLPMLAMVALPYGWYLPGMWAMTGIAGSIIVFYLCRILFVTRSKVAVWFSVSLIIAMFSGFSEVVAAWLGFKGLLVYVNSVTAALFSSLMAALAISQQMRDERLERRRAQAELSKTYNELPIGLFTLDANGVLLRGNPTLKAMLGREVSWARHTWADYFGPASWTALSQRVAAGATAEMEIESVDARHAGMWFMVRAKLAGAHIEGSLQDITERVHATERLSFLADHDPLTGVLNRRGIEKRLDFGVAQVAKGRSLSVGYLDLDRFKLINDLYGHGTGDEVLRQICLRVQPHLDDNDVLGRIGGDEFVLIFMDKPVDAVAASCQQMIDAIQTMPFIIADKAFRVGCCVGLVEVTDRMGVAETISSADRACQEAKQGSADLAICEKDSPVFHQLEEEMRILKSFGLDSAPDRLFLVMQPLMSLRAPFASLNFEVLLRMHGENNTVEPAWKVISTAEKNGRIAIIDRWVLVHVLEWIEKHADALDRTQFVSVNLSGGSLNNERFIEDAFSIMAQYPRAVHRLCLEITESVAVRDIKNTLRFIERARDLGAKIALDDFGVGYTSFAYLSSLSADLLKIDGSLVTQAIAHPANLSIIEAIAGLSHNLGMTSVAEWVDNLDTVKAMAEVGIDYIQGFCIARPQLPGAILGARSAADFIQDPAIEAYVKTVLAGTETGDLWDSAGILARRGFH